MEWLEEKKNKSVFDQDLLGIVLTIMYPLFVHMNKQTRGHQRVHDIVPFCDFVVSFTDWVLTHRRRSREFLRSLSTFLSYRVYDQDPDQQYTQESHSDFVRNVMLPMFTHVLFFLKENKKVHALPQGQQREHKQRSLDDMVQTVKDMNLPSSSEVPFTPLRIKQQLILPYLTFMLKTKDR